MVELQRLFYLVHQHPLLRCIDSFLHPRRLPAIQEPRKPQNKPQQLLVLLEAEAGGDGVQFGVLHLPQFNKLGLLLMSRSRIFLKCKYLIMSKRKNGVRGCLSMQRMLSWINLVCPHFLCVKNCLLKQTRLGQDFKRVGLSTLTDILNVVAPPISEHEVIQVWLSHDMQGYDGVETLAYRALARVGICALVCPALKC